MAVSNNIQRRQKIRKRIRKKISGTAAVPRLSVFKSNTGIYAQIINDETGKTLVSASSKALKIAQATVATAEQVGDAIAAKALEKGIQQVVFDRSGYIYHGKIKQLAAGARAKGLKF